MILNGERWHYLAVKNYHNYSEEHNVNFCCLNCLNSFRTGDKLKSHIKVCKHKYFCGIVKPSEGTKILEFNQYLESDNSHLSS